MTIERQLIATWFTPEERLPKEGDITLVTIVGKGHSVTYDHCFALAEWWNDDGWFFEDPALRDADITVLTWCDLAPYGAEERRKELGING